MLWFKVWCNAKWVGVNVNRLYYTQVCSEMQCRYGEMRESHVKAIETSESL